MLDKAEKITHFRHFSKKKALHNCIICAVQLWLREPSSYLMYNYTLHKKDSIKKQRYKTGNLLLYCRFSLFETPIKIPMYNSIFQIYKNTSLFFELNNNKKEDNRRIKYIN